MAFAMQQVLLSWVLVGVLALPADQVGILQALIGVPAVFFMLLGGARSDSGDPRRLMLLIFLLAPVFPLFLVWMVGVDRFSVWTVMVWGLGISLVQAWSTPAQQAILNRVCGQEVQRGVTAATAVGFVVQVIGLLLAGQMDTVGLSAVLIAQAATFLLAALLVLRIAPGESPAVAPTPAWRQVAEGVRATLEDAVIKNVLLINFTSTIFNAGSFMTVFPFIVKRVYDGDAWVLAALMAFFFSGGAIANAVLLRFMPLARPGVIYLSAQLSRIPILLLLWIGEWWFLLLGTFLWGINMGTTSNLARMIVQESAAAAYRGRILAVFAVTMVGSAPVGALFLGWLVERVGSLNALLPAMLASLVLALYGMLLTPIWRYRSGAVEAR